MTRSNLLKRVALLQNKVNTEDITEKNIMILMSKFGFSFNDIKEMPIYTYNKFIQYLNESMSVKTLGGKKIGGLHG